MLTLCLTHDHHPVLGEVLWAAVQARGIRVVMLVERQSVALPQPELPGQEQVWEEKV